MNDKVIEEIKKRAQVFAQDNLKMPTEFEVLMIENAMLVGASIVFEAEALN